MTAAYDVIVLGVGGMGSAACAELACRGRRVLGLEQFPLVHDCGSSHGHTRIIRTAYYEHPSYVPLLRRAFDRWHALEQETGRHLLTACPCLTVGPAGGELVNGVRASVREHGLPAEELSAAEVCRRYPFHFADGYAGVLEQQAGFLYVEDCVRAHIDSAVSHGAEVRGGEAVRGWAADGSGISVITDRDTYRAARLVVTAGAWATKLLADVGVPLTVMRQTLLWFDAGAAGPAYRRDRFPIFLADTPEGAFYGLPAIDRLGVKLARHYGAPELPGPDGVGWDVTADDERPVRAFADAHLTAPLGRQMKGAVCLYTLSPDRHFVLDRHPGFGPVAVACGFSGHGFKFAPVVGEALADLADTGQTDLPVGMFRVNRFSLIQPT